MLDDAKKNGRRIVALRSPEGWYHFERNMRYRCLRCEGEIDAPPARTTGCACGNLRFDVVAWRLQILDDRSVEAFVVE